jgi:hypothetical protein
VVFTVIGTYPNRSAISQRDSDVNTAIEKIPAGDNLVGVGGVDTGMEARRTG